MTVQELSDLFDVLYNNITSNQAPGLNEYEKSVFLTKAQEEIIKNYFNPKSNPKLEGFDDSPKRQADFASLIRVGDMISVAAPGFDRRTTTKRFAYPAGVFLVLNELIMDSACNYVVKPISYAEYDRLMAKPYKFPPKYQAWRLITNEKAGVSGIITPVTGTALNINDVLSIVSKSLKPINFVVSFVNASSQNPIIVEGPYLVTITLTIGNDCTNVWEYLTTHNLQSDDSVLSSYIEKFSLGQVAGKSFITNVTIDSTVLTSGNYDFNLLIPAASSTSSESSPVVELIGRFNGEIVYTVRYVKRPSPIILVDLHNIQNELSINNEHSPRTSELPDYLHEEILQRAVELAKVAWAGEQEQIAAVNMVTTAGQRSE